MVTSTHHQLSKTPQLSQILLKKSPTFIVFELVSAKLYLMQYTITEDRELERQLFYYLLNFLKSTLGVTIQMKPKRKKKYLVLV